MCAENYAWGNAGNDTCPENAARIGSEEACQRAAAVMGKIWDGSVNETEYPSGCYAHKGDSNAYFNAHPVGSGSPDARPLCAVGTAPLRARRAVRDYTTYAQHAPARQRPHSCDASGCGCTLSAAVLQ